MPRIKLDISVLDQALIFKTLKRRGKSGRYEISCDLVILRALHWKLRRSWQLDKLERPPPYPPPSLYTKSSKIIGRFKPAPGPPRQCGCTGTSKLCWCASIHFFLLNAHMKKAKQGLKKPDCSKL